MNLPLSAMLGIGPTYIENPHPRPRRAKTTRSVIRIPAPVIISANGRVEVAKDGLDHLLVMDGLINAEAMGGGNWFVTIGRGDSMLRISINCRGRVTVVEREDGKPIK